MTEYLSRPDPEAVKPKEELNAPMAQPEQGQPTGGQTRTSTPNLRLKYRPVGAAQLAPSLNGGAALTPKGQAMLAVPQTENGVLPELPEPGALMASGVPLRLPDQVLPKLPSLHFGPLKVDQVWTLDWWKGCNAGMEDGIQAGVEQVAALAQHAPEILPQLPALVAKLRESILGFNQTDLDNLLNALGEAKEAHFKAKPYQQGHDIGEIVAGLLLAKGGEKLLKVAGRVTGLSALAGELRQGLTQAARDGLRPRGPSPLGATPDGPTVPLDPTTVEQPGGKGAWNKDLNPRDGRFKPNEDYRVGPYTYYTDAQGRVRRVSGELKLPSQARDRNGYQQTTKAGKEGGAGSAGMDDGGHLIASMFDGAGERINLKAMLRTLNQNGDWRDLERAWERALNAGEGVRVDIRVLYKQGSDDLRAEAFDIEYWLNGKRRNIRILN